MMLNVLRTKHVFEPTTMSSRASLTAFCPRTGRIIPLQGDWDCGLVVIRIGGAREHRTVKLCSFTRLCALTIQLAVQHILKRNRAEGTGALLDGYASRFYSYAIETSSRRKLARITTPTSNQVKRHHAQDFR